MRPTAVREVDSPQGPGRVTVRRPRNARGSVVLGHGAGGQGWSVEIVALTEALTGDGWAVALVDQPVPPQQRLDGKDGRSCRRAGRVCRRCTGRPSSSPATGAEGKKQAGTVGAATGALPRPLVVGGRSAGARVACRTAVEVGANSVLCLSFPLHPPGKPESSRAEELLAPVRAGLPVHVVQGERDPFGTPDEVRAVLPDPEVVSSAKGSHSFGRQPEDVVEAVREWLRRTHG